MHEREIGSWKSTLEQYAIGYADGTWTIKEIPAEEQEVNRLLETVCPHCREEIIIKGLQYIKAHWNEGITKDMAREMNRAILQAEKALSEGGRAPVASEAEQDAAEMYCFFGKLQKHSMKIASYWYQKAAILGHPEGEFMAGVSYYRMYNVNVDDLEDGYISEVRDWMSNEKALFWLRRALNDGWQEASRYIDAIVEQQHERENASLEDLIEEAENGSGIEQFHLAGLYEIGDETKNIPVDYEEAVYWYKQSLKSSYMPYVLICETIASILEEKIGDKWDAWRYYRKAYCLENGEQQQRILGKIKKLEPEAVPDKAEKERKLNVLLQKEICSEDDIRQVAALIEETQIPVLPLKQTEDEEEWLIQVLPKAEALVRAAFKGNGTAENALGVFYSRGMALPFNYAKQEYWFRRAYMDGYGRAYENLRVTFMEQDKEDEWVDFVMTLGQHGSQSTNTQCDEAD